MEPVFVGSTLVLSGAFDLCVRIQTGSQNLHLKGTTQVPTLSETPCCKVAQETKVLEWTGWWAPVTVRRKPWPGNISMKCAKCQCDLGQAINPFWALGTKIPGLMSKGCGALATHLQL